ncbi:alpha/beta fold hydrolase [Yoonia sp. I 8.24]|uniref:alpha/beta fold hydrolase n=1 Tax=Yoonia sp. I 8.24 TaxID=1537229 RepID=UPI001EDDCF9F|nr:alpha/beta fold hydrolase [Yoonia sp. I 8.24]MCG3267367.1 alpha/beta fold hydrolase [Yoonia sp. I 8.24]
MPNAQLEYYAEPLMVEISGNYSYLNVSVVAPPKPTKAIFLFHDLAGRADDFIPLAPHLAHLGYRVVMIDFPGRGKSAWLNDADYTLRMYVDVFLSLIKAHGLQQNAALGQGWGAMMTLLFESVIGQPFQQMYLCDLPMQWSYGSDNTSKLWAKLTAVHADTAENFNIQADKILPPDLVGRSDFLSLAGERMRLIDGKYGLSLDPAIFENIQKTNEKVYDLASALKKCRSPIWLLQGTHSAMTLNEGRHTFDPTKIRQTEILRGSNASWQREYLLLLALGVVVIGMQDGL